MLFRQFVLNQKALISGGGGIYLFDTMPEKKKNLSPKYQLWVDARKRFNLSHAHVQMAREIGLNPKKLGKLANHKQQPWKAPLPVFIEELYFKRFGKERPDEVLSMEDLVKKKKQKRGEKKQRKAERIETGDERSLPDEPF